MGGIDDPLGRLDDEREQTTTTEHVLIDFVEPGAPLVITFGFYFATGHPNFEFLGRLRKLEQVSGRAINKILVRDPSMRWYLDGIAGLGDDVPSTATALRDLIARLEPSSVTTIGQSMGAYGAILYGTLAGADKVIPFGPLSCFDARRWELIGDHRWQPVLDELAGAGRLPMPPYDDLPAFLLGADHQADIDLIFGSSPGPGARVTDAIGHDAAHALRLLDAPNVVALPVRHSQHAVVEHFRAAGVITEVLAQRIFGDSLMPAIQRLHGDDWTAWLVENQQLGSTIDDLRPVMLGQLPAESADRIIAQTGLLTDLARFEDTPPVFTA